jgi:hypothetical protein
MDATHDTSNLTQHLPRRRVSSHPSLTAITRLLPKSSSIMAVPRRRQAKGGVLSVSNLSSQIIAALDINYIFSKTKVLLLWGWTPLVIGIGLYTDPRPSWVDIINIWE